MRDAAAASAEGNKATTDRIGPTPKPSTALHPSAGEHQHHAWLDLFYTEVAAAEAELAGLSAGVGGQRQTQIQHVIDHAMGELNAIRQQLLASPESHQTRDSLARDNIAYVWCIVARHREIARRLGRRPFTIDCLIVGRERKSWPDSDDCVTDIVFVPHDMPISPQASKLKVEIDAVTTVIQAVFKDRLSHGPWNPYSRWIWQQRIQKDLSDYLTEALGIAKVGLQTTDVSHVEFARRDLARLTSLFSLREAGHIKNAYVKRLGVWSGVAVSVFALIYVVARTHGLAGLVAAPETARRLKTVADLLDEYRNFDLLAIGTAIGTWLSFSLRRTELTFADLAVLEPDRLEPAERIFFMIGLSGLVGLLFFSGAITGGVGGVTGPDAMHANGVAALMIGMLAGVAERALGLAITRRSLDFATLVGGGENAAIKMPDKEPG